jgi:hypothetical protein
MKKIEFTVNEKKSYIKAQGWPEAKPGVTLPLIVSLTKGATVTLSFDETKNVATGKASDLQFISDQFEKRPKQNITGNLQLFSVYLHDLELTYDSTTGEIKNGGGYTYVMGEPQQGGAGALATWYLGPSALLDGNSTSFDLSNGLGCAGGLLLEVGSGDPTNFIIHIEAEVAREDLDGDGVFEKVCSGGGYGVPVNVGNYEELVMILFGVTNDGGGIGFLPNGRPFRIPPWGPPDPIIMQFAEGLSEVVRGLVLRDIARDSSDVSTRQAAAQLGLEMAEKALEKTLKAIRKEGANLRNTAQKG